MSYLIEVQEELRRRQVPELQINNFLAVLGDMERATSKGQKVNPWVPKVAAARYVEAFQRVAAQGLEIDNKTVFLTYRGKLMVSYGYQAYKNRLLKSYPDSVVDVQLVKKQDTFSAQKNSGTVVYQHAFGNPFSTEKENPIVGAYCVIKNKRGEFIELLSMEDVGKIRATAQTQTIWTKWLSEMVKKSVLKRACKLHFFDLVEEIEDHDNEGNDPERVAVDADIQAIIEGAQTLDALTTVYNTHKDTVDDLQEFLRLLGERRVELEDANAKEAVQ